MAFERQWAAVPPQAFTADGSQFGLVTVADTAGFRVKQSVFLLSNSAPSPFACQVKVVLSTTMLIVGTINNAQISNWPPIDISAYTVASGAAIGAEKQNKANPPPEDITKATYEGDPVSAFRNVQVDQYGDFIDSVVDADGKNRLAVDADVDVTVNSVALFTLPYDSIQASYPSPTQSVYMSYLGGLGGMLQQTVTVNFTDSTQNFISTVLRTPVS